MSDGTETVSKAASTARNLFTCRAETPLVSPREYSRSSPLWRKRRITGEKCDVSHYTCQGCELTAAFTTLPVRRAASRSSGTPFIFVSTRFAKHRPSPASYPHQTGVHEGGAELTPTQPYARPAPGTALAFGDDVDSGLFQRALDLLERLGVHVRNALGTLGALNGLKGDSGAACQLRGRPVKQPACGANLRGHKHARRLRARRTHDKQRAGRRDSVPQLWGKITKTVLYTA